MSRLDDYRTALLAVNTANSVRDLEQALDDRGAEFVALIRDYGLGPLWHARTGRDTFHESRVTAEAYYLAQEQALAEIDTALHSAGIEYAVIKGAANRLCLYDNPATRPCHDIDLLVRRDDRSRVASALVDLRFAAMPEAHNINHELVLSRGLVNIDLHWGVLREGRLRTDPTAEMIDKRVRLQNIWALSNESALFILLVHPAFAKHLASWNTGLHRVADIVLWLHKQPFDREVLLQKLEMNGVRTAAWATLRWVQLLTQPHAPSELEALLAGLKPGRLRRIWLDWWLSNDLAERTSRLRWLRLLGFSTFLHDRLSDSLRVLTGRFKAHRRVESDYAAFGDLLSK